MIIIEDKTTQKPVYFPKEKNSASPSVLRLFCHLSKSEYTFDISGCTVLDLYYVVEADWSVLNNAEYDYSILDSEDNVLQNGLLRIGEYDVGDIIYDFKEEYVIYNPETGESEIIEYGDCTDAVNDAYRSGFQSGNTVGYNNGYESGLTQGFPIGYQSGRTDGWNAGYEAGEGDGFQNGYDSGHSKGLEEGFEYGYGSGFTGGYESGFTDGYESGCSGTYEDAYNAGLQAGIESGKTIGFESGWTNGYSSGYTDGSASGTGGWESGYTSGYTDGYSSGYESGNTDGFNSGYTNGKTEGFEDGYESGSTDGYNSGWTDGYSSGWTDGYESGYTPTPSENIIINAPTTIPASATDFTYSIVSNLDGDIMVYRNNELWNSGGTFQSGTTSYRQGVWGSTANTVIYRIEAYGSDSASTASRTVLQVPYSPSSGYTSMPFTVQMLENGNINWAGNGKTLYQINGGEKQVLNSSITGLSAGDEVQFTVSADTNNSYYNKKLTATGSHNVYGNIMSLNYVDFESATAIPSENDFAYLFGDNATLINAENLVLPATSLTQYCYAYLFEGCSSLINAPKILPATILAKGCYYSMFWACSSLVTTPLLSSTTLSEKCYEGMFKECTSLTTAPELPATTLVGDCYYNMFGGCSNLSYIKCLAEDISASGCVRYFSKNVASAGTFVKSINMSSWTSGENGIPVGWTVINE